jgi:hypothetical protein
MITVRPYNQKDYEMVCSWWDEWEQSSIPEDCLPDIGAVAEIDGKPVACAWLFRMDCKMCWIGFPISTKSFRGANRKKAIVALFNALCMAAKNIGYRFVTSISNTSGLQARYRESGFKECDRNIIHMVRSL